MNTEKIDEIIKILRAIADTSTSNKIALLSVILSAIAVGSSIYFSYKTRKQYIESLNPLLSFQLVDNCGLLFLTIKNTGQSEAIEIKIIFDEISNNGEETLFDIAKIFKSELTLYPNEKVTGYIAKAGANISTEIAPTVKVRCPLKVRLLRDDFGRLVFLYAVKRWSRYWTGLLHPNFSFIRFSL